jgi:hypothetical protein
MTPHIKHLIITVLVIVASLVGLVSYEKYRLTLADKTQTATDKLLKENTDKENQRDKDFNDFKIQALQAIAEIKTAKQGVTVLQPIMQGAAPQSVAKSDLPPDVQKQLPNTAPDARFNLLTDDQVVNLAKSSKQCDIDKAGLTTCEENKQSMQEKIDSLTRSNKKWEEAGTVPRWNAMIGISKTREGSYKPAGILSYRVQHNWGLSIGAVNNAVVGGLNINVGGNPK